MRQQPGWIRSFRDFLNGVPREVPEATGDIVVPDSEAGRDARWLRSAIEAQVVADLETGTEDSGRP